MRMMKFVLPIMLILIVLIGCDNDTSGKDDLKPVTNLNIIYDDIIVGNGSNISIEEDNELFLIAVMEPVNIYGTVFWISENDNIAKVTPLIDSTVAIKGVAEGAALITVTAQNNDNKSPIVRNFTVHVQKKFVEPIVTIQPQQWYSLNDINYFGNHTDDRVWAIAAGGGKYVAVGGWLPLESKAIAHSSDAVNWEKSTGNFFSELRCITYANGRFVAGDVGDFRTGLPDSHADDYIPGSTYYSVDGGETWTGKTNTGLRNVLSLTYGDGKWLALGLDGRMAVSTNNAVSWTPVEQKTINRPVGSPSWLNNSSTLLPKGSNSALRSAVFAEGKWIVVGMRGLTAWSEDLETWNVVFIEDYTPNTVSLYKIIYAHNKLFVVGDVGRMFYSEDLGLTWKLINEHGYGNADIYNIVYANGFFVTVGSGGHVEFSDNGMEWFPTTNEFGGTQSVFGLAYAGGWWIAGARYGVIAVSNVRPLNE